MDEFDEAAYREMKYQDERFDELEARIGTLELRLVSLTRKVYDLSPEASIYFQDKDVQQERTVEAVDNG